ncbi:hypothetical protein [Lewinella sp. IMCC34183]|uniref:hypothetical protein n=1 Tax=Lewinella sp. IMCC34183 TaxID=2248762 RepID=UPI000E27E0D3|nr:hypothetical protein [Lewinella sp. IMCC34183]
MITSFRRTLLIFLPALFLAPSLGAQVGISTFYNSNDATVSLDNGAREEYPIPYGSGAEVALNYWFRLPKNRVEFLPTVYYAQTTADGPRWREYGFQFKTNVYVFDLATDCDCPTFGKQGPRLDKGFFIQLAPGVARHSLPGLSLQVESSPSTTFSLGAGVGIDFGLSNLVTLTPLLSLRHHFGDFNGDVTFTDDNGVSPGSIETRLTTYQVGLQATFRFDKRRY